MERRRFEGWKLVGWAALAVAGVVLATLSGHGTGEEGLRAGIRATARRRTGGLAS